GTDTSATSFAIGASIDSCTPPSGPTGTSLTITGTGFTGATAVTFNGVSAGSPGIGFKINSSNQITATVPVGASTGRIKVTTPLPGGILISTTDFLVSPKITSFLPTSGKIGT